MTNKTNTRRNFLKTTIAGAVSIGLPPLSWGETSSNANELFVFVGAYTANKTEGINIYRMDLSNGALTFAGKAVGVENPSYLAIDPQKRGTSSLLWSHRPCANLLKHP